MILSALALWRQFNITAPLNAEESEEIRSVSDVQISGVFFDGNGVADGAVRVFAKFARPNGAGKMPAVLLLADAEATEEDVDETMEYFVKKGYAVLAPDYVGEKEGKEHYTVYPPSLSYANYQKAELYSLEKTAVETCWFEWTALALYAVKYLKEREDIGKIGVVGMRIGGEIAWKTMLSEDVSCGVPINAAGWLTYFDYDKFADNAVRNMNDNQRAYLAGIESQSYAPFVKCPVLMLCSMRDYSFDYDRAYDTFIRLPQKDGSAIAYSNDSGAIIGPTLLKNMELFLEKNLKGREIFIPETVDLKLTENGDSLTVTADVGTGGIVEKVVILYAETGEESESAYREWQYLLKADGKSLKNGVVSTTLTPYSGASYAFVYAYAKYINGFRAVSRIAAKKLQKPEKPPVKSRVIYSGEGVDCFSVADYKPFAVGGIFLESEAVPKQNKGYGNIAGVYSIGGVKTYKIASPKYTADENAMLEFDVYSKRDFTVKVVVEVLVKGDKFRKFAAFEDIKGGGKWKRVIFKANEFKDEETGAPLPSFAHGKSLTFAADGMETEFSVTNVLWL